MTKSKLLQSAPARSESAVDLGRRLWTPDPAESLRSKSFSLSSVVLQDSSSYQRSTRKDVDYKVSEKGVSLAYVSSADEDEAPRTLAGRADVADSDMPLEVQRYAVAVARDAVRAYRMFREVARYVKTAMDAKFGHCWQCHVGKECGVRFSYVPGSYMFVTMDEQAIILYRSS